MTDLRALLGERYDVVMQAACGCDGTRTPHCYECSDSTWDHECPGPVPCRHRAAESVLARVLPDLLDAAAAERDALAAKVERVRALHRAFGIYDECDCDDPDPATHLDVDGVGLTCNLMYRACAECCRDDVYQTEDCANYHDHRLDEDYHCPTIRALDEEAQPL